MKRILIVASAVLHGLALCAAMSVRAADAPPTVDAGWDAARVTRSIDAAREARAGGDPMAAERLCYAAFQDVDRNALAAIDAYADLLEADRRPEAATVRTQAAQLRETKESQARGTQPSSSYLGFAPADLLNAYAALLRTHARIDDADRMRSLALAYQQVQQAHFERTTLYRQGRDPPRQLLTRPRVVATAIDGCARSIRATPRRRDRA